MELLDQVRGQRAEGIAGDASAGGAGSPPAGGEGSFQQRLEASAAGRLLISAALVVVLCSVMVRNLPESELRRVAFPVVEPIVNVVGLDQIWNLFAPDPPRQTFEVLARIEYSDGSLALWEPPRNDRWRKWLGAIRLERNRSLWEPTAAWIAGHHDDGGLRTVRVELIQLREELLPPGGAGMRMAPQETRFFVYEVPAVGGQ